MASGVKHTADNNQAVCDMPFKALKIAAVCLVVLLSVRIFSIISLVMNVHVPTLIFGKKAVYTGFCYSLPLVD